MSCTFKEYLADSYKLKKMKDLKTLKMKPTVHGLDSGGAGLSEADEDPKTPVDSDEKSGYNDKSAHKDHPLFQHTADNSKDDEKSEEDESKDSEEENKPVEDKNKNPDKQGLIRKIDGAHLVYKRVNEDGTYDELWMYNISRGNKDEFTIRSEILSSTDIEQKSGVSASGTQKYILWTNNNVQMMQVTGLPN